MSKGKTKVQLFVQGSIFLVISNVCIKAINFFLLPLYTENLTPSMLGVSDSITTFTGILFPMLVLGLDSAYSAFYFDKSDIDRDKRVFSTLCITFFILGIVPILLSFFSKALSVLLFEDEKYYLEMMVAMFGVTFNLWYLPFSLELRLKNKMGRFGLVSVICSFVMVVLNIIFVSVLQLAEMSLILSTSLVSVVSLFLYVVFTRERPKKVFFDGKLLKKMMIFSFPLIPSVLMAWVLSLSDRYILLHYHGNSVVGLYGVGARFVTIINVIVNAINTAYTTFAFGSKEDNDAKKNYFYVFNVVSVLLLFICFSVAIFSKEIIYYMTDEAYMSSYTIIRDMLYSQALYAMSTIVSYGIIFKKKSVYSLIAVSCGALVNLALNFVFIPEYGLNAAAFTTVIGYLVSLIVSYYFSEKLYPCNYGMIRVMITCIGTYVVAYVTLELSLIIRIVVWILVVGICVFVYRDIVKVILAFARNVIETNKNHKLG